MFFKICSSPESGGRLSWEFEFFNAKGSVIDGVIDVGKVFECGTLSNSTEFIVD